MIEIEKYLGFFHELPDGRIVLTFGYNGNTRLISYRFEDDSYKDQDYQVSLEEYATWKLRRDLHDFPNARDPRLPYEFDLHWDIKFRSQLQHAIKFGHDDLEEILFAAGKYGLL